MNFSKNIDFYQFYTGSVPDFAQYNSKTKTFTTKTNNFEPYKCQLQGIKQLKQIIILILIDGLP